MCTYSLVNTVAVCKLHWEYFLCQVKIHHTIPTTERPISPSNLFQTVVDGNPFSLMLNWTQHLPPAQNREVESFVVELSTDGGTTFKEVCVYMCDLCQSLYVYIWSL